MNFIKYFLIVLLSFVTLGLNGQSTWSKSYNLDVGWDNNFRNLRILNSELYVATGHVCMEDTLNCYSISKFTLDGDLLDVMKSNLISTLGNRDCLYLTDTIAYVSVQSRLNNLSGTVIAKHNLSTNEITTHTELIDTTLRFVSQGITYHLGHFYVYGTVSIHGTTETSIMIFKFNSEANQLLDTWEYREKDNQNILEALQVDHEGNLVFKNRLAITGLNDDTAITTIDTSGNVLSNQLFFGNLGSISNSPTLAINLEGTIYFTTEIELLHSGLVPKPFDQVGYIEIGDDTISGTMALPQSYIYRHYDFNSYDITVLSNGDIAVCGNVRYDNTIIDIEEEEDVRFSAFIARLTPKGEVRWMKRYMVPNPFPSMGKFQSKSVNLENIVELPDGSLLAAGTARGWFINLNPMERELWILRVDADGCLDGEECSEVVWIDGKDEDWYDPVFEIGDLWTYDWETEADPDNFDGETITYQVVDTITEGGKLIHIIESNRIGYGLKMYQDWDRIYFYNETSDRYELHYDFNANYQYETTITNCQNSQSVRVKLDTFTDNYVYKIGGEYVYDVSIVDRFTDTTIKKGQIIRGIGSTYGGLLLEPDTTCVEYPRPGDLRCLQAHDRIMNRQPYDLFPDGIRPPNCDTNYISSVIDVNWIGKLFVIPNPTSGELTIELPDILSGQLSVRNVTGQVVLTQEVIYTDEVSIDLSGYATGMYLVEVVSENGDRYLERVVVY